MARRIIFKENGLSGETPPSGYQLIGFVGTTFSQINSNGVTSSIGSGGGSGTSGSSGTSGTSGTSGVNGTSGTSGINGTSGTSGSGTSGTSGINGTSGTSGISGGGGFTQSNETVSGSTFSNACGGSSNTILNSYNSTILGGNLNQISIDTNSAIVAGMSNSIKTPFNGQMCNNVIMGGLSNDICDGQQTSIISGSNNTICLFQNSSILAGSNNCMTTAYGFDNSVILGGFSNYTDSGRSSIIGGCCNILSKNQNSSIIGGKCNQVGLYNSYLNPGKSNVVIGSEFSNISSGLSQTSDYTSILSSHFSTINSSTQSTIISSTGSLIECQRSSGIVGGNCNKIWTGYNTFGNKNVIISGESNQIYSCGGYQSCNNTLIGSLGSSASNTQKSMILGGAYGNSISNSSTSLISNSYNSKINGSSYISIINSYGSNIYSGPGISSTRNNIIGGFYSNFCGATDSVIINTRLSQYNTNNCRATIIGSDFVNAYNSVNPTIISAVNVQICNSYLSGFIFGSGQIKTSSNSNIISSDLSNVCDSHRSNILNACSGLILASSQSQIIGGSINSICGASSSTIIGGKFNTITGPAQFSNGYGGSIIQSVGSQITQNSFGRATIVGGVTNQISESENSAIIGGSGNSLQSSSNGSVILGGQNLTLTNAESQTVLVPRITTSTQSISGGTLSNTNLALWMLGTTQSTGGLATMSSDEYVEISINGKVLKLAVIQ